MIKVLGIIKEGNRIKYYDCISEDNGARMQLGRDALIQFIRNKQCVNATIQNYNNKIIIRVKKAVSEYKQDYNNNENTIFSYINNAKSRGLRSIKLDDIEVDTTTLKIMKNNKQE